MTTQMTLNLGEGSVRFNFSPEAAQKLQAALGELMTSLKAIATTQASAGKKTQPEKTLEYQHTGEVFLEVFCNPNIWPTPFAAKLLLTIRDDRIRLTTEAELTRILEDLNQYLEQTA
ncbi:MAG: hypothetical protein F6K04_12765 [Leptolyngbya sp. SIO4C5]|nr:hypothetical protein [Leptolyngbya sp. SIO4C5]